MNGKYQLNNDVLWKQRFRAPHLLDAQIALNYPERGLVVSNQTGVYQLYAWDVNSGDMNQLTHHPEGKPKGFLSANGRYIYYHEDSKGDECGHYVRLAFDDGEATNLTPDLVPYHSYDFTISANTSQIAFTTEDSDCYHLFTIGQEPNGSVGNPIKRYTSIKRLTEVRLSACGRVAVFAEVAEEDQSDQLVAFDLEAESIISVLKADDRYKLKLSGFAKGQDDYRLCAMTSSDGYMRPFIWNPRTGMREDVSILSMDGDIMALDWSKDGTQLLLSHFHQAEQQLYVCDLDSQDFRLLEHPRGTFGYGTSIYSGLEAYFGADGEVYALWNDAAHLPRLLRLDPTGEQEITTTLKSGEALSGSFWRSISYASFDRQAIQGWLATPENADGPLPTIIQIRGGPHLVTTDSYSPQSQAWLDHGFAYLTINYRGSTTFGRDFETQIWGNPGYLEVQDIVAARQWLIDQGISDPAKIVLSGWSYGGYLTLLALGQGPDLWAGGIAGVAIADWAAIYNDLPEISRGRIIGFFGGRLEERPEQYKVSSPITYAEQVTAPILVIQGEHDSRGPAEQMQQYEKKLKDYGKEIEVLWVDMGHVGPRAQVEENIKYHKRMIQFAQSAVVEDTVWKSKVVA